MLFEEYLSRLIQYTEDRRLIMSRQSEAWACFVLNQPIEYAGFTITRLGMPANNPRNNQS